MRSRAHQRKFRYQFRPLEYFLSIATLSYIRLHTLPLRYRTRERFINWIVFGTLILSTLIFSKLCTLHVRALKLLLCERARARVNTHYLHMFGASKFPLLTLVYVPLLQHLFLPGPLMVITQKVTSLAYNIHDGLVRRTEELTPMQRHQAVQ